VSALCVLPSKADGVAGAQQRQAWPGVENGEALVKSGVAEWIELIGLTACFLCAIGRPGAGWMASPEELRHPHRPHDRN